MKKYLSFPVLALVLILLAVGGNCLKLSEQEHTKLKNNDLKAFRKAELDRHNKYRAKHHAPPLKLCDQLNKYAQDYAKKLAKTSTFEHSQGKYGENLYMASGVGNSNYNNGKASDAWYNEVSLYDWNHPQFGMDTGHFTQVVWKGSVRVGFGFASNGKGQDYIVAEYDPPGNYEGQFPDNVLQA